MTLSFVQQNELRGYLHCEGIAYQITSPRTFTSSVNHSNALVINVKNKDELQDLIKKIDDLNKDKSESELVNASVIGGGRGGNNNSYSIGKVWEGVNVFIQLGWDPEFKKNSVEVEEKNDDVICSISPNMMLHELNQRLYDNELHCPTLVGCLPFMSFAGGLSTGSHTAYGFLSDIVEGIDVILPNGEPKKYKKGEKDFDLICQHARFGLLGTITGIDIRVKKNPNKLQRVVELSTYGDFMAKIEKESKEGEIPLESRAIIFSPIDLSNKSPIKMTRFEFVVDQPDQGRVGPQVADDSLKMRTLLPKFAKKHPKWLSKIFRKKMLSPSLAGTTIARPADVMGAESQLAGQLTELGLFFDYQKGDVDKVLRKLQELLADHQALKQFPVNMAIFIRFPKKPSPGEGHVVAIDFASMGVDLSSTPALVSKLMDYMISENITPRVHYGKSHGVGLNNSLSQFGESWNGLKERYEKFYQDEKLNQSVLSSKLSGLEKTPESLCLRYRAYCDEQKKYFENKIQEYLMKKYPVIESWRSVKGSSFSEMIKELMSKDDIVGFEKEQAKIKRDDACKAIFKKYEIIVSLYNDVDPKLELPANEKIANFEKKIDENRGTLIAHRDPRSWKWFSCSVTMKAAHARLFKVATNEKLVKKVDEARAQKNAESDYSITPGARRK